MLLRSSLWLLVVVLPGLTGCPDPVPPYIGDPAAPMVGKLFVLDVSSDEIMVRTVDVAPGDAVPLLIPQQGGFVVFAGVRLRNVDPTRVTLRGQFNDAVTGNALSGRDTRTARYVADGLGQGFAIPDSISALSTVPNIPACPDFLGRGPLRDAVLEIVATDTRGKTATFTTPVRPSCLHDDVKGFCLCTCGPNYVSGKCGFDAGADADGAAHDL